VSFPHANKQYDYSSAFTITTDRPLYVKTFVILIVLALVTATAYSLIQSTFNTLLMNTGGMILGLWSIRSFLIGNYPPDVTPIDLILTVIVVLILLTATIQAVLHCVRTLQLRYRSNSETNTAPLPADGRTRDTLHVRNRRNDASLRSRRRKVS
jgi:hypothetical protein